MLKIRYSNQFKKDYKSIKKRGYDINILIYCIEKDKLILTISRTGSHSDLF